MVFEVSLKIVSKIYCFIISQICYHLKQILFICTQYLKTNVPCIPSHLCEYFLLKNNVLKCQIIMFLSKHVFVIFSYSYVDEIVIIYQSKKTRHQAFSSFSYVYLVFLVPSYNCCFAHSETLLKKIDVNHSAQTFLIKSKGVMVSWSIIWRSILNIVTFKFHVNK